MPAGRADSLKEGLFVLFRKTRAEKATACWNDFGRWLTCTEEQFKAFEHRVRQKCTNEPQHGPQAWQWVCELRKMREELMRYGWLPPREQDVLTRYGLGGALLRNEPTKWELNRQFSVDELPGAVRRYFEYQ